jgi:hypothetical protein
MMDRTALSQQLWPGIRAFWGLNYNSLPTQWTDLFDVRSSDKAYEEMVGEFGFGLANMKDPGKSVDYDDAGETWKSRFQHEAYALGFILTREAVKDNQYFELIPKYTTALQRSMRVTREILAAAVYDRSSNIAYTGGDGQPLGSAVHPLRSGGVLSNLGTSADLNETSLEAAHIAINDWTDERGLRISAKPLKLVIGNGNQFVAERLLGSDKQPGTANNDVNAMRRMGLLPKGYAVNNDLQLRRQWYLQTDVPDGMIAFDREALDIQQGDGLDNQVMKVLAYERYSHGWNDPRGLWVQSD